MSATPDDLLPDDETPSRLAAETLIALEPLRRALDSDESLKQLLRYLGFRLHNSFDDIVPLIEQIKGIVGSLRGLAERPEGDPVLDDLVALIDEVWTLVDAIADLEIQDLPDPGPLAATLANAVARLPAVLLIHWMDRRVPAVSAVLRALGIIAREPGIEAERFDAIQAQAFMDDPKSAMMTLYGFEPSQDWKSPKLLQPISKVLMLLGNRAGWSAAPSHWLGTTIISVDNGRIGDIRALKVPLVRAVLTEDRGADEAGLVISPSPSTESGNHLDGLLVTPYSTIETSPLALGAWSFEQPLSLGSPAAGILFKPITPQGGPVAVDVGLVGSLPATSRFGVARTRPIRIAGGALRINGLFATLEFGTGGAFLIEVGTPPGGIELELDFTKGDSFSRSAAGNSLRVAIDLGLVYDAQTGLDIDFGAELELYYFPPTPPGPIRLDGVVLRAGLDEDLNLYVSVGALVGVKLGVVVFSVSEIGVDALLRFGSRGKLGPHDLTLDFRPPRGIGIAIGNEDSLVRGGGFIALEPELGRYSGALEVIAAKLELSVLAMLVTPTASNPDAVWSLLLVVTSRFPGGILLPFGFRLTGIGGLFALNRRMDVDAIIDAFPTGGLAAFLFPADPVGEAPLLLAQLDRFFPIEKGRFVGGLFVELSWGTGRLVSAQLGVVLDLPAPVQFIVVGRMLIRVGEVQSPIVSVRIDVIGVIRPEIPEIYIEGALVDSFIGPLRIEGGAVVLLRLGEDKDFVITIGGFHPSYRALPGLRVPKRVGLDFALGPVEISARAYFAITPNTLQLGLNVAARAQALGLILIGGFGFDVILRFDPFGFEAEVYGFFELSTTGGLELVGISLQARIVGPSPWKFSAEVEVRLLGIKIGGRVQGTFGETTQLEPRDIIDVAAQLVAALTDPNAMSIDRNDGPVVLTDDIPDLLLAGDVIEVQQSVAPLEQPIEHLNESPVVGGDPTFVLGTPLADTEVSPVLGSFAAAATRRLKDQERLTRPGFEPAVAGVALRSSADVSAAGSILGEATTLVHILENDTTEVRSAIMAIGSRPEIPRRSA